MRTASLVFGECCGFAAGENAPSLAVANRAYVFENGRLALEGSAAELCCDERVQGGIWEGRNHIRSLACC